MGISLPWLINLYRILHRQALAKQNIVFHGVLRWVRCWLNGLSLPAESHWTLVLFEWRTIINPLFPTRRQSSPSSTQKHTYRDHFRQEAVVRSTVSTFDIDKRH